MAPPIAARFAASAGRPSRACNPVAGALPSSTMRRLLSPSALFAMWTLLFALPMLPFALHRPNVDRAALLRQERAMPNAPAIASFRRLRSWTAPLAPLVVFVPISYPLFAVTFAMWPRITGHSLNAELGRWQFALATLPLFVAPFIGVAVLSFSRAASGAPNEPHSAPPPLSGTIYGSMIAVFAGWARLARSLRIQRHADGRAPTRRARERHRVAGHCAPATRKRYHAAAGHRNVLRRYGNRGRARCARRAFQRVESIKTHSTRNTAASCPKSRAANTLPCSAPPSPTRSSGRT